MRKRVVLLLTIIITSCSTGKDKPLPVQEMKKVMWDLLKADEWYNTILTKDSSARLRHENIRLYEEVFLVHKITRETFYKSYRYYQSHPDQMKVLIDSLDQFSVHERARVFEQDHGQAKKK